MAATDSGMSRREFLGYTTGLIVYFTLPQVARPASGAEVDEERGINAFLHIAPDSRVTFFCGKVEMGEGNRTALAQMAAEELSLPISSVQMVMGDTDRVPYDGGTWGSTSIRFAGVELRAAAARAREILAEMAAEKWGVERAAVIVEDGRIALKSGPGTSVGLGELTRGTRIVRKLDREPELKPHSEYRIVGKPVPQMESRAVVTGTEAFVCDVRLPGMLYGAVLYPPSSGATLTGIEAARAESLPGVAAVVREGDFVGVVAVNSDVAREAVGLIRATWRERAHPSMAALYDDLKQTADEGYDVEEEGDVAAALENAHHTLTARYCTPFVAHAPIEPHSALAAVDDGRVTIYSNTQTPFLQQEAIAESLELGKDQVRIIVPRVGGGFGGKTNPDVALAAARLARAAGKPVMFVQSRAEELTWNYFKPAAVFDISCGANEAGEIVAWDYHVYNCGDRGAETPYRFANSRVWAYGSDSPLSQGAWRGLAGTVTTFAREVHLDQMAVELGQDPVALRLRHLGNDPRLESAVRAAAEAYGWTPRRAPTGQGVGFAAGIDVGTRVAQIVEVEVDRKTGAVSVKRVVCAQESGLVINPDGMTSQVEGGITMGLGPTLREIVRYESGKILTDSFASYPIPTTLDAPKIETVLVPNPDHPPQGGGEPAVFPIAGAVANAVFDATGKRLRELPLSPERVLAALET